MSSKIAIRSVASLFSGGKLIAKLPEMSAKLAIKIADTKTFKRFAGLANNEEVLSALKKRIKDLSDGGKQFLDDFADASDDVLKKFIDKPELVDAWKKIRPANPEVSKNIGALEALNAPKGSRPDPRTYLGNDYVAKHLAKFEDGAVRFTTDVYPTLGNKNAFVIPKSEFDNLMIETGGDLAKIEKKLSLDEGSLTSKNAVIAWIKKKDFGEIKMPTGNEVGANSEWIPGGKTAGGLSEGILDLSNPNIPKILYPF